MRMRLRGVAELVLGVEGAGWSRQGEKTPEPSRAG